MIYTNRENVKRYLGLSPELDKAIRYLLDTDIKALSLGIHEIDGRTVFCNRQEYDSIPLESAKWEGHRDYLDIQIVLEGEEKIGVTDTSRLTETAYSKERDRADFTGPVETWFTLRPGDLLIVWPEDAHMVKVQVDGQCHLQKACIKVRV